MTIPIEHPHSPPQPWPVRCRPSPLEAALRELDEARERERLLRADLALMARCLEAVLQALRERER